MKENESIVLENNPGGAGGMKHHGVKPHVVIISFAGIDCVEASPCLWKSGKFH